MIKISPSQIHSFRMCQRLIGFQYVQGIRPPPSAKQAFGSDVHKELELWLRESRLPGDSPQGQVAKQGIRNGWLPVPSQDLLVEHNFSIHWLTNKVEVVGVIDCVQASAIPLVIDHKTTSSLSWAMTEDALKRDPQALIYATWAMVHWQRTAAKARWIYYAATSPQRGPRRPAGALPVETTFHAHDPDFRKQIAVITDDLREIYRIRTQEIQGVDLPPNPAACSKYGGCHFVDFCQLSPDDVISKYFD